MNKTCMEFIKFIKFMEFEFMFFILFMYGGYVVYHIYSIYMYLFPRESANDLKIRHLFSKPIHRESTERIERLFSTRVIDPYYVQGWTGKSVIMTAAEHGRHDIIQVLMETYGRDPEEVDKEGKDTLMYAVLNEQTETVRYLVEELDVSPNNSAVYHASHVWSTNDLSPLLLACKKEGSEYEQIVNILLNSDADIFHKTVKGETALMLECKYNRRLFILYSLLKEGHRVHHPVVPVDLMDLMDPMEYMQLEWKKNKNVKEIKDYINVVDFQGKTALMHAVCSKNDEEMFSSIEGRERYEGLYEGICLLLENGAHVNVQDKKGMTAFMYAMEWDGYVPFVPDSPLYLRVLDKFLEYDVDVELVNCKGKNVIDLLKEQLRYINPFNRLWPRKVDALEKIKDYRNLRRILTKSYFLLNRPSPFSLIQKVQGLQSEHLMDVLEYVGLPFSVVWKMKTTNQL